MRESAYKRCDQCGSEFERDPKLSNRQWEERRFCGRVCAGRAIGAAKSASIPVRTCPDCGVQTKKMVKGKCASCYAGGRYRANREHALEVGRKWRERNPDYWNQPHLRARAREHAESAYHGDFRLRRWVLERDAHSCQRCGATKDTEERLAVHHIDGDRSNQTVDNLLTLCFSCHAKLHYEQGDLAIGARK